MQSIKPVGAIQNLDLLHEVGPGSSGAHPSCSFWEMVTAVFFLADSVYENMRVNGRHSHRPFYCELFSSHSQE